MSQWKLSIIVTLWKVRSEVSHSISSFFKSVEVLETSQAASEVECWVFDKSLVFEWGRVLSLWNLLKKSSSSESRVKNSSELEFFGSEFWFKLRLTFSRSTNLLLSQIWAIFWQSPKHLWQIFRKSALYLIIWRMDWVICRNWVKLDWNSSLNNRVEWMNEFYANKQRASEVECRVCLKLEERASLS